MPKIAVDECPAGPAMDAAVAKALGWHWHDGRGTAGPSYWQKPDGNIYSDDFEPSTNIAAAWEPVDYILQEWSKPGPKGGFRYGSCRITRQVVNGSFLDNEGNRDRIFVGLRQHPGGPIGKAGGDCPLPLVICRAFLKANGVEFVEVPE